MRSRKSDLILTIIAMIGMCFAAFPSSSYADDTIISTESFPGRYMGTPEQYKQYQEAVDLGKQAQSYLAKGDLEQAEKLYLKAFETDPSGDDTVPGVKVGCSRLGEIYYRTKNWQKCVQYYTYASDLALSKSGAGGSYDDWFQYSVALLKTGDAAKSRFAYNQGIASLVAQNNRDTVGEVIEDMFLDEYVPNRRLEAAARVAVAVSGGDAKLGKEECSLAIKVLPEYAPAHLKLGEYYFFEDNKDAAKKEWRTAINLSRAGRHTIDVAQKWLKNR